MSKEIQIYHSIQEKIILRYLDKMWKILPVVFVAVFLVEIFLFLFVNFESIANEGAQFIFSNCYRLLFAFLPTIISYIFYFPCYIIYKNKKCNFHIKKSLYQVILYLAATSYAFIHPNYPVLLALYIIPIVTSSAFSKNAVGHSFSASTIGIIGYAIVQTTIFESGFYIQVAIVTEMIVVFATLIILKINDQIHEAFEKMIDALQKSNELRSKLHTDSLTGAFTREKLELDMKELNCKINSIAFVDMDNFKTINDNFGHGIGDEVLQKFVHVTNDENIFIYRLGGDEFLIASFLCAEELYKALVYKIQNFKYETKNCFGYIVTISCGIVHTKTFSQEEINRADRMMYTIKNSGKNLVKILDE
ncbi:MAG: GGDEF domain-containing protein [Spirochaetaceae bacterium]|nr:GGDEF domain-containing protein [Spirochaetaceae bacterium]